MNIDKCINLLRDRGRLIAMQLSVDNPVERATSIEVKVDGLSYIFPAHGLSDALNQAIKAELNANAVQLAAHGVTLK